MANQKIRQEINLTDAALTSTGTLNGNGIVQLDTTQYSGTPTFYFETVAKGAASNTGTIKLRRVGTTTDDASIAGETSTSVAIRRSASFSPPAGQTQYMVTLVGDGTRSQTVYAARIIVLQDEAAITKSETQIEIGNQFAAGATNTVVADITNPKFWKYTAANWDGTTTFYAEVVWTTSAKNTTTITLCRTSDNAANVTIVSAGTNSTGYTRTRVSFTPVNGETYKIRALGSTTKSNYTIACAKIVVDQSSTVTKHELQYLLLNTADSNATGVQNYLTTWNSSEWDAGSGSITYYHAMDSDNSSNSIKLRDVTAGADIPYSTITGSGQVVQILGKDSQTGQSLNFVIFGGTSVSDTNQAVGQSFTASGSYFTYGIYLVLNKVLSPTDNVTLTVLSGSITGTTLGTSVVDATSISTTKSQILFAFASPISFTSGTKYYMTLVRSGGRDTSNYVQWWAMNANPLANGGQYIFSNNAWGAEDTITYDQAFIIPELSPFTTGNNLDCWVLNTTGVIAASRILVLYAYTAAPTEIIPDLIMAPLLPPRRFRL